MKPVYVCLFAIIIISCKAIPPTTEVSNSFAKNNLPKDLVIFIDGTSYTPEDNSNINKLKNALQKRDDISTFYTVGVGAGPDSKTTGQLLGVGMSVDVQNAYRFICENYKKNNNDHYINYMIRCSCLMRYTASDILSTLKLTIMENILKDI